MNDENPREIDEDDFTALRLQPDAARVIASLLGVQEMEPADTLRTEQEVNEYVKSGDMGEARALIQHSKVRRELWTSANEED